MPNSSINSSKLKEGYTTGTCAASAAKGASFGLVNGFIPDFVEIELPAGRTVKLKIEEKRIGTGFAECCVRKDAGDDPDVTHRALIFARVEQLPAKENKQIAISKGNSDQHTSEIQIVGGIGVGVVTKPGLQVRIGEAAINPVPQKMIRQSVQDVIGTNYKFNIKVTISVPDGEKIAKRTFNERLGITGGISIIGTTGIVRPMSEEAIKTSLKCELDIAKAMGHQTVILTPGNLAESAVKKRFDVADEMVVLMSNFVGFMLTESAKLGFKEIIIAGHPGKLAKLIRGDFNTHSSKSEPANDIIMDLLHNEKIGDTIIAESEKSTTIEGIIQEIKKSNLLYIFDKVAGIIETIASDYLKNRLVIGVILFDMQKQLIGMSTNSRKWSNTLNQS